MAGGSGWIESDGDDDRTPEERLSGWWLAVFALACFLLGGIGIDMQAARNRGMTLRQYWKVQDHEGLGVWLGGYNKTKGDK